MHPVYLLDHVCRSTRGGDHLSGSQSYTIHDWDEVSVSLPQSLNLLRREIVARDAVQYIEKFWPVAMRDCERVSAVDVVMATDCNESCGVAINHCEQ